MSSSSNTGKKYALIFAYDPKPLEPSTEQIEDTNLLVKTLQDLEFEVLNGATSNYAMEVDADISDEENSANKYAARGRRSQRDYDDLVILNQKPRHTEDLVKEIAKKKADACCILLYFIVMQAGKKFFTDNEKEEIQIIQLLETFERQKFPVLLFIQVNTQNKSRSNALRFQANLGDEEKDGYSVLYNKDGQDEEVHSHLPKSANKLIVHLPKFAKNGTSVVEILSAELRSECDIYTSLTNVNNTLTSHGCEPSPKFSSTLLEPLYLAKGLKATDEQVPKNHSTIKDRSKYLAYAFLFSEYSEKFAPKNDKKLQEELKKLKVIQEHDKENLKTLGDHGVTIEFCVPNGEMTTAEFKKKLSEILQGKDLDSYDGIFIIVSTHGCKPDLLLAYDGFFSVDYICQELSKCTKLQDKPKVILSNACRGCKLDVISSHKINTPGREVIQVSEPSGAVTTEDRPKMSDILIVLATVESFRAFGFDRGFVRGCCLLFYLRQVLEENDGGDIFTILTRVMQKVAQLDILYKEADCVMTCKQQVTFTSALRKPFSLPPKEKEPPKDCSSS